VIRLRDRVSAARRLNSDEVDGSLITDSVTPANIFNKYFASVFTCDDGNIPHFTPRVDVSTACRDVSFTPLKVFQVLKHLKRKTLLDLMVFLTYYLKDWPEVCVTR